MIELDPSFVEVVCVDYWPYPTTVGWIQWEYDGEVRFVAHDRSLEKHTCGPLRMERARNTYRDMKINVIYHIIKLN